MSLGQIYYDFSRRCFDLSDIYSFINNETREIYLSLVDDLNLHGIRISDKVLSSLSAYDDILRYTKTLFKIINGKATGYSRYKISTMFTGTDSDLMKLIPEEVFKDDFFFRIFSKVTDIYIEFPVLQYDIFNFLVMLFPSHYNFRSKILTPFEEISSGITNLFGKFFSPVDKTLREDYMHKSSYLSLILMMYVDYYIKNFTDWMRSIYSLNIVSGNKVKDSLNHYINTNFINIASSFYKFIVNNSLSFVKETDLFKEDLLDTDKAIIYDSFLRNISFNDVDYKALSRIFRDYVSHSSYNIVENYLYPDVSYNYDLFDIDHITFLDIEKFILTRISNKYILERKNDFDALIYYAMRYRDNPVYFINTITFLFHYYINNLIYDKKIIPMESAFEVFYRPKNLTQFIMNLIKISNRSMSNTFIQILNTVLTNDKMRVLSMDYLVSPIYKFIDSDDFTGFVTSLLKAKLRDINDFYLFEKNIFSIMNNARLFFKITILRDYISGVLFGDIVSDISARIRDVIGSFEFWKSFQEPYDEFKNYSWERVYNLLSSWSLAGTIGYYLYTVPLAKIEI